MFYKIYSVSNYSLYCSYTVFMLLIQRKRAEKEEKFSQWRKSKDHLNDLLDQLKAKLIKAKTGDTPHNRREIKDKINEIKVRQGLSKDKMI